MSLVWVSEYRTSQYVRRPKRRGGDLAAEGQFWWWSGVVRVYCGRLVSIALRQHLNQSPNGRGNWR